MLDLKFIRTNPDIIREAVRVKGIDLDVDRLLQLDSEVLSTQRQLEDARAELKRRSKTLGGPAATDEVREANRRLREEIPELELRHRAAESARQELLLRVPNPPDPSVPYGTSSEENVPVKHWGELPSFDFPAQDHVEIMQRLDMVDTERGVRVAGSRGYVLKGWAVLLEQALLRHGFDRIIRHGFTPMRTPSLIRDVGLFGTGQFPRSREQTYHVTEDDLCLTGSADAPLTALHSGEILDHRSLPLKYAAISPCFRREVGSAGRDVRGVFRVHEFMKVEQFVMCVNDRHESVRWHERMLTYAEEVVQGLELPYRIVNAVTGDLGPGHVKMYDLECWIPSEERYRENYSASYFLDWQARRANLRYRDEEGKVQYVHTLNNTVIATPRILIPFCEVHQQADGSIRIPVVLQPYLGVDRISAPWPADAVDESPMPVGRAQQYGA
jgi:seryl-tRNA synthetase